MSWNLQEAHDTVQWKPQTKQDKEAEAQRRHKAIENEERFQELKASFFGITFTDGVIQVKVLEIEVSLETMKVIQCRGLQNKSTEYHYRIIDLVNLSIRQIQSRVA